MSFTPPAPNAVNFTAIGYYEPGRVRHAFPVPVVGYVAPLGSAVNFTETYYAYPTGLEANFGVPTQTAVQEIGAVTFEFFPEGHFTHIGTLTSGAGAAVLDFVAEGHFKHGVKGVGAVTFDMIPEAHAKHGIKGFGAATLDFVPSGVGVVVRYEVRGEIRLQGALVNRRVRTYNRASGDMVGDVNSVAGKFKVHAGFAAEEI